MSRRKRFNRRKVGHKRNKFYTIARGGIQLSLLAFFLGACTITHRIAPTTIDVQTEELVTDSISQLDNFFWHGE